MATSWRLRSRYPDGEISFLDTDYFAGRIRDTLPPEVVKRPAREVKGLPAPVVEALGRRTVGEASSAPAT